MSAYVDCPECGVEEIPPNVSMCSACEIAARYEKKLTALSTHVEAVELALEAAAKSLAACSRLIREVDEGDEILEVAAYAQNRANVAFDVLRILKSVES